MAKIKTSALVADIKGTVGGNVFASNKGGNYVRRYKKPTNANTSSQQVVRNTFGAMAGEWRVLTDEQRQSWNEGAVNFPYQDTLGETRVYSGQQLFNKLNNNLAQYQSTLLTNCPTPQSFPDLVFLEVINTVATNALRISLNFDGTVTIPNGYTLIIRATTSISAGVQSPQKGLFKNISTANEGADIDGLSIIAEYNTKFGTLVLNDTIFISVLLLNTISGEASVPVVFKSKRLV